MKRWFGLILAIALWFSLAPTASAANTSLVPCKDSPAFLNRQKKAPDNYYFKQPYQAYSEYLVCGEDGLPHLPLDRLDRAVDVAIPIGLFLYIAGFIGWSGRAYLQTARQSSNPEEKEIFIDIGLAIQSLAKGLFWPVAALNELISGKLTTKEKDVYVSPR
jgi:photosystem I subunit III